MLDVRMFLLRRPRLRDQVAAVYNRVGSEKRRTRRDHRSRKTICPRRTASGIEGWVEQRFLDRSKDFDGLQKLTQDNLNDPVQAPGVLRNDTNLHIAPGRDTEHLYQLASGAKVGLLKRSTAEKQVAAQPVVKPVPAKAGKQPSGPVLEDWWLVKDDQNRVGWVLARMVDVDVPLDIAQYAEGQRFIAFFVLDQVQDGDKEGAPIPLLAD